VAYKSIVHKNNNEKEQIIMTNQSKPVAELSTEQLVEWLIFANDAYRKGEPVIDDDTYDQVYYAELVKRDPEHPFLNIVEPENDMGMVKIRHKTPMLSTDKAYSQEEIITFVERVIRHADAVDVNAENLRFRITPKLDGMAARYEDDILATRGNGLLGNDISRNLKRGLVTIGGTNTGNGEIVIEARYFADNLSDQFSHPRNFVTGLIGADTLSEQAQKALQDGVVHFVPYQMLNARECDYKQLSTEVEALCKQVESECEYPVDGSVIDLMNKIVCEELGATSHHYNWQIAKKTKGETAVTTVNNISWQTGRTGRITPVLNVKTINLSGADISNVTAHNAGNVKNLNVGTGAEIEIVRSGEVIPKLLAVVKTGEDAIIPQHCPACGAKAKMERDFLVCQGADCIAQIEAGLQHFFRVLGNIDLFGPKTIKVLVSKQITQLPAIYALQAEEFVAMGFGAKQATNLVAQLKRSRTEEVEDWRFLAAFGIQHLGRGDSRKLLKEYPLEKIIELDADDIVKINGFGPITAKAIPASIKSKWNSIQALLELGFNLIVTDQNKKIANNSPVSGKSLVFTGAMAQPRNVMKKMALSLGAKVQASVNKKTDILVIGAKVGAKKIEKAKALGTEIMTEQDYLELIQNN
jgi:DNA ligase (NAD+)